VPGLGFMLQMHAGAAFAVSCRRCGLIETDGKRKMGSDDECAGLMLYARDIIRWCSTLGGCVKCLLCQIQKKSQLAAISSPR
jgi:hypothetical protein